MAPPDLPPIDIYKTLASLLQQVEAGHKFRPVTVQDIAAAQSSAKVGDSLCLTCEQHVLSAYAALVCVHLNKLH